jgi:adenine deaminase
MVDQEMLATLLKTAKGEEALDLIIRNGRIINVFTNSVEDGFAIGIKNGLIALVEKDAAMSDKTAKQTVDARGSYLCPGFIDAHTHLDGFYSFHEFVPASLKGGTTTVIAECAMVANSCGFPGLSDFFKSTKGFPLRCFFVVPPLTPPFPAMERSKGLTFAEFSKVLKRDDCLGIGEGYWTRIVEGDERTLKQAALALKLGKTVEGHAAGARANKLTQYLITGITSCHESTTVEEAVEKLRQGIYVMIRQGFVRKELSELSKLKDLDVDRRRLMLVSDFFDAPMLCEDGYLDSIVKTAITNGFDPLDAIKMVTINPADYYGLRHLGAIAPLRFADILFLKDLHDLQIEKVMANGEVTVENGRYLKPVEPYPFPDAMRNTVRASKITIEDLRTPVPRNRSIVRVINAVNNTITREEQAPIKVSSGFLDADLDADIAHIAVINRNDSSLRKMGLIKGTGVRSGSFATTCIWDTANILSVGSTHEDMVAAVNRLIELQGGIVVTKDGKPIYELPMPVYGLIPLQSIEELGEKTKELNRCMRGIGITIEKPFLALQTIPFTGLPFIRLTDKGLLDVKNRRLVPLFL